MRYGNGNAGEYYNRVHCTCIPPLQPTLTCVQEMGVMEVKKEMAVETYDIDAVKSQLGEVLDEFIGDIRYATCVCVREGTLTVCVCL